MLKNILQVRSGQLTSKERRKTDRNAQSHPKDRSCRTPTRLTEREDKRTDWEEESGAHSGVETSLRASPSDVLDVELVLEVRDEVPQ